jgi:hypothetical protein
MPDVIIISQKAVFDVPFVYVKAIILLGLTDVWSAIRNATVARLSRVVQHFTMANVNDFFSALASVSSFIFIQVPVYLIIMRIKFEKLL